MPLNAEAEAVSGVFNAFDDSIASSRNRAQLGTRIGNRLMVEAVDLDGTGSQQSSQAGIVLEQEFVATAHLVELVVLCIRQVMGKVVVEGACELKRQQLCAITDSQQRDSPGEGAAE